MADAMRECFIFIMYYEVFWGFFPNKLIMNFSKKLLRSGVRKSEAFTESCSLIKCIAHGIAFKNV